MRINLIGWKNRAGLSRDLAVMQDVLTAAGHEVAVHGLTPPRRVARALSLLAAGGHPWDLTIHTEQAARGWMELSHRNVLLPNPEWFEPTESFRRMDAVLCKTRWTADIMTALHPRAILVGFTTPDRGQPGHAGAPRTPLHVAGKSHSKGTGALIGVWTRHPEWPVLTVVARKAGPEIPQDLPANVRVIREFIDDNELRRLQVTCGFHLCPSAAEGFGHTLVEGMSTGAVVLTTDAPPMNELVTRERGVLVPWVSSEPMRAGHRFEVDPAALEASIAATLAATPEWMTAIGSAARRWFEENNSAFRSRLLEVVEALL